MCLFSFFWPLPHITVRNLVSVLPLDLICSFSYFKFITFWRILKTFHVSPAQKSRKALVSDSQVYFFGFSLTRTFSNVVLKGACFLFLFNEIKMQNSMLQYCTVYSRAVRVVSTCVALSALIWR